MAELKSLIVYESRYGNTEKIAYAMAAALGREGEVEIFALADAPAAIPEDVALLVIGGPTEGHGMTAAMGAYLERFRGVSVQAAAAFDTRLHAPRWLSGSAASSITRQLQTVFSSGLAEPISFFVKGRNPVLEPGELERAQAWAFSLADRIRSAVPASAG